MVRVSELVVTLQPMNSILQPLFRPYSTTNNHTYEVHTPTQYIIYTHTIYNIYTHYVIYTDPVYNIYTHYVTYTDPLDSLMLNHSSCPLNFSFSFRVHLLTFAFACTCFCSLLLAFACCCFLLLLLAIGIVLCSFTTPSRSHRLGS